MADRAASAPSIDLAPSYTIIGAEPLNLSGCTYPEDDQRIVITSRTLHVTETGGGNFTGSLTLSGFDREGAAVGGSFVLSGTASAGNPRGINGTMQSNSTALSILNGSFSGAWSRSGGLASFRINISGRGTTDGDGFCDYSSTLPMVNVQASPTSDDLSGSYNAEQNTISVTCPDPLDNETLYPQSGTVQFTEGEPDNFTGSMSLNVLTKTGTAAGGFELTGTSPAGSQSISGTMTGTEIWTGQFSGSAENTATVSVFTMGVTGVSVPDPAFPNEPPCTYSGAVRMTAPVVVLPEVMTVTRTYPGFFLQNSKNYQNVFTVPVDWKGTTPGTVRFKVNSQPAFEKPATAAGASHTFNLTTDFPVRYPFSTIEITPITANGVVGTPKIEKIYVFPYPVWLQLALNDLGSEALNFTTGPGIITANIDVQYPTPPLEAKGNIPSFVPYFSGPFGISETFGKVEGHVTNLGNGELTITGNGKIQAMGQSKASLNVTGNGTFLLGEGGLDLQTANFHLDGQATFKKTVPLLTALPGMATFNNFSLVRRFNETAKLTGVVKPSVLLDATWEQEGQGNLVFQNGTGLLGLQLDGIVSSKLGPVYVEGSVSGKGTITLGVPAPTIRSGDLTFQAGAKLKINHLFGGSNFNQTITYKCTWTAPSYDPQCDTSDPLPAGAGQFRLGKLPNLKLDLLHHNYDRFGRYEAQAAEAMKSPAAVAANSDTTLVSNVFPGADPTILPVGASGKMLMWVRQDPNLPVLQSTGISWSYFDGTNWTSPSAIANDTRAEMSPVMGVDASGNVVAVWSRVKEAAFNTPVTSLEELPLFYKQFEVVSSVFNTGARTWGPVGVLTDDLAYDTGLHIAHDADGNLLLTWQSNPSGEFTGTTTAPATLKYSFWNGSNWNAPQTIANNLANLSEHSAAIRGNNAFLVVPQDPNTNVPNDEALALYTWNGSAWSPASTFAGGGVNNQLPFAIYDGAGQGRVIWRKGTDLVQASLADPVPSIVRADSDSTGFNNLRLLHDSRGNLALMWQEMADSGPANIIARSFNPATQTWSSDIRLNEDERMSKDADGYFGEDGKLRIAYLASQINRVDQTVTVNGQPSVVSNIPEFGQTDLRLLEYAVKKPTLFDYDADGRADLSVRRPTDNRWYLLRATAGYTVMEYGVSGDKMAPADYDGDGKTDVAVFRPSEGKWYIHMSATQAFQVYNWGQEGDLPVPTDRDADGSTDLVIFRPSNNTWYTRFANGTFNVFEFGVAGDKPVRGDFDGDGKGDIAVYRPSNNNWYIIKSNTGFFIQTWGEPGDVPTTGDFDGDGKTDQAVFRPSTGQWFLSQTTQGFSVRNWGEASDVPIPADYDGDGKTDVAIYRPSNSTWYIVNSRDGIQVQQYGETGDVPTQSAFNY